MASQPSNPRRTIGVVFGGRSLEHDVSIVSGLQVLHAIDPDEYSPLPIYIDHAGRWWIGESLWESETFKRGGPDRTRLVEVALTPIFGASMLAPVGSRAQPSVQVDVFLPVLHGTFGEDGCLQGLLELAGCAYVGCGVLASAIGMNKRMTKIFLSQQGIPVLPWLSAPRSTLEEGPGWLEALPRRVDETLGWPVIVKPCSLGSSAGVSVARRPAELHSGVLKVFEYDSEALIEPFIKNRLELNVAVVGLDRAVASVSEMPITAQSAPLSFGEKYKRAGPKSVGSSAGMAGALRVLDPQDLSAEMRERARQLATTAFSALGCEGISRVDFIIDADTDQLFFNEINTLPGSLAYYLWSAAPHYWTITELLSRLVKRAERIHATKLTLQRQPPPELRLLS